MLTWHSSTPVRLDPETQRAAEGLLLAPICGAILFGLGYVLTKLPALVAWLICEGWVLL